MALKLGGEEIGVQEKIETIMYAPGLQDSGDLEASTKTITATAEASGLGNADYSKSLTLPKPDDARLALKRIAARLAVTIDSFNAATHLYCRVYVDAQDADHRLFDEDWDSIGAKLDATDKTSGTIFDLLKDGAAHTFYFFFWVNQANNAVISLVQLWEGVGNAGTGSNEECLRLTISGLIQWTSSATLNGTGTRTQKLVFTGGAGDAAFYYYIAPSSDIIQDTILVANPTLILYSTVATDICCLQRVGIILRSLL